MLTGSAVLNTLRRHHLFRGLSETALQNIATHTTARHLPRPVARCSIRGMRPSISMC